MEANLNLTNTNIDLDNKDNQALTIWKNGAIIGRLELQDGNIAFSFKGGSN